MDTQMEAEQEAIRRWGVRGFAIKMSKAFLVGVYIGTGSDRYYKGAGYSFENAFENAERTEETVKAAQQAAA